MAEIRIWQAQCRKPSTDTGEAIWWFTDKISARVWLDLQLKNGGSKGRITIVRWPVTVSTAVDWLNSHFGVDR